MYLFCQYCQSEYSAEPGDYWDLPDSYAFNCCDEPMLLVERRGRFASDKVMKECVTMGMLRDYDTRYYV